MSLRLVPPLLALLAGVALPSPTRAQPAGEASWDRLRLRYDAPAEGWNTALPVGNGRLGAMVFGDPAHERLALNEETLWSGGPYDPTRPGGAEALPEIRRLLFAGDVARAHDLFGRTMMGVPYEQQKYQPLANLLLEVPGHEEVEDYRRELDLDRAVVRVSYRVDGVRYTREVFASAPGQVVVVRFTADRPGSVSFDAELHGVRNPDHSNYGTDYFRMDGLPPDTLRVTGRNTDYLGIDGRLVYETRLVARTRGGSREVDYRTLRVRNADEAVLVVAAATSFVDYRDVSGDPPARVRATLAAVADRPFDALLRDHVAEHRGWFRRVSLELGPAAALEEPPAGTAPAPADRPTDLRLAAADSAPDPDLAALAYQFGRYLLIASSRPGTQPANLQGIWNADSNPWWDSKYTVNINLPMNYWPAEPAGLPELAGPLFQLVADVAESGRPVAREHWGAPGWVLHQNTDLWRAAAPMDGPSWGAWPVGGAWLVTHLWEHFRFDPDTAFLARWYPVLRDQAHFLSAILVEEPEHGWLVTAPSNSPENFPAFPGNGRFFDETSGLFLTARTMQAGPTMDVEIVGSVFDQFRQAARILGRDAALSDTIAAQRERLPPLQVGKHGQLQEWLHDWDEIEPEHRHLSHLWGLYPGDVITPGGTPELARAAAVSIRRRGMGGCGWSEAWKVGLWARLGDGEAAADQLGHYLSANVLPNLFSRCGQALQVDGSLGMTGAIGEMLLQSHTDTVDVLPALPASWARGRVTGLRARGGFTVGVAWDEGRPTEVVVRSRRGLPLRLRGEGLARVARDGRPVRVRRIGSGVLEVETEAGGVYRITPVSGPG